MPNRLNVYEKITDQMMRLLDEGVAPWRKPWEMLGVRPTSLSTNKPYRGINHLMLWFTAEDRGYSSPYWGTYRQITELNGQVRKGEKGTSVVLWTQVTDRRAEENGEEDATRWIVKGFTVFNSEQADWQEGEAPVLPEVAERPEVEVLAEAEKIVARYLADGPSLSYGGDRAYYTPSRDAIRMPERNQFSDPHEFYSTLFHEFGHSTGHENRLNREGIIDSHAFGDPVYSREELVAEFTSAFVCAHVGTMPAALSNSASYIAGWRSKLQDDPQAVVFAASRAQRAADLILGEDA